MAVSEGGTGLATVDTNLAFSLVNVAGTVFYLPRFVALDLSGATPKDIGMAVAMTVPGATGRSVMGKVGGQALSATTDSVMPVGGKTSSNTALVYGVTAAGEMLIFSSYATPTQSSVTVGTGSTTLLASNTARKSVFISVPSGANVIYMKFGTSPSTTSYTTKIFGDGTYEMAAPIYTGVITAVTLTGTTTVIITEGTA